MGIFNFLKDVGHKLFGDNAAPEAQLPDTVAKKLEDKIKELGLGIENAKIKIEGDKAIIEGSASSQEALEKAILAIGNTNGIAQVDARIEAPAGSTPQQPTFYTVVKGDNLSKIAKQFYGNPNHYQKIFEANRPLLKHPDEIYPGQQLRIPQDKAA